MILKVLLFSMLITMISCKQMKEEVLKGNIELKNQDQNYITCNDFDCLEKNKNKKTMIEGKIRMYTPNKTGKGANYMFWDWEILLADGISIPLISKSKNLDISIYKNKNVLIEGDVFYGIIIGSSEGQNATGYRIDANSIREKKTTHNIK